MQHHRRKARITRIRRISYGLAASILLGIGLFFVVFKNKDNTYRTNVARTAIPKPEIRIKPALKDSIPGKPLMAKTKNRQPQNSFALTDRETRQSLFYYTKLIEIRRGQISRIQDIDPGLYKKSQKGIEDLNQVYNHLKNQLPGSVNQQKVLELMIQNLQLQEQVLTNQLQLIQSLQSPNPSANEKDTKNI